MLPILIGLEDNVPFVVIREAEFDALPDHKKEWLCTEHSSEVTIIKRTNYIPSGTWVKDLVAGLYGPFVKFTFSDTTRLGCFVAKLLPI